VLYGTDLGNDGPGPGIDAREVAGMQAAGMDGHSIVASATSASAARLGLSTVGAIAPGMQADLVGVDGDPLSDPSVLPQVRFVMRAGEIHRGPR
jgi:imidazolonepropionase-like amidohydrolase